MAARKKLAWAELKVGLFVFIALALLMAFILRSSWGVKLFSLAPKQFYAKTYLPSVERLKSGSPVWLAGIEVGYVTDVKFVDPSVYGKNKEVLDRIQSQRALLEQLEQTQPPNYIQMRADLYDTIRGLKASLRTVEVTVKIDNQYRHLISTDSEVSIGSAGLIGESYIDLSVGSFGQEPKMVYDPELKKPVILIEGLRTAGIREILTGANDVVANFAVLSEQLKRVALTIDVDRIGNTITDVGDRLDRTMKEAESALVRANRLIVDVQEGKGTIGQFLVNSSVYDELESTLQNVTDMADQVRSGKGTLGRILNEDTLYKDIDAIVKGVDQVVDRVENGQGTLGLLTTDRALYDQAARTAGQVAEMTDRLNRGEGSLGRVLRDEALYHNVNQTMSEITKLIYDFRQNPKRFLTINFKLF